MITKEFVKCVETILSMCTSYLMGQITRATFVNNLRMIANILEKAQLEIKAKS